MRYLIFLITFWLVLTGVGYLIGIFISKMIDKPISKLEEFISKILFINFEKQMDYKEYFIALFGFNLVGLLILFLTLCFQKFLPLNPMHFGNFSWDEALNTAVSFVTNTNWQSYTPESSISYFSQMTGLALQNFLSASTGMAVAFVLFRALKNVENKKLGNFFLDVFRINIYLLLPISFLAAIFLISQGVIQNFSPYIKAHLFDPFVENGKLIKEVLLPMGPVASQEAIKLLGTNGGGFFNANSAHPFENPNYITNAFEAFLIMIIPASLVFSMGNYLKKEKDVFVIYGVMSLLFIGFNLFMYKALIENFGIFNSLGIRGYYLEGQELRFGIYGTTLFTTSATATSCGAVNAALDSMLPLGGFVPMFLILLGEIVYGGVGTGIYTMISFVILASFLGGLMIGRIPEYMGKRIDPPVMWSSVIVVLTSSVLTLIFMSIALSTKTGISSILNPGPHGISEVLYAYGSTSNNNGSAFGGLNASTVFYNLTTAIAMFLGRFLPIFAILYMSDYLSKQKIAPPTLGTLPTNTIVFGMWLLFVIILIGALTFFPAIATGPFEDHLKLLNLR